MIIHIVKPGDTLSGLAKKYGTTVQAIAQTNNIKNPDIIYDGTALQIPTGAAAPAGIREQLEKVLDDIEKLPSFQALQKLL